MGLFKKIHMENEIIQDLMEFQVVLDLYTLHLYIPFTYEKGKAGGHVRTHSSPFYSSFLLC